MKTEQCSTCAEHPERAVILNIGVLHEAMEMMIGKAMQVSEDKGAADAESVLFSIATIAQIIANQCTAFLNERDNLGEQLGQ